MINIGINKTLTAIKEHIRILETFKKKYEINRINDPEIFIDLEKNISKVKEAKAKALKRKKTQKLALQELAPFDSKEINLKGLSKRKFSVKIDQIFSLVISVPVLSASFCTCFDNCISASLGSLT